MSRLRRNLLANFIGRGWGAVINFVFVPFYLRFLGIEAYGLVGFFATLQVFASLTDLGLGMTLNREMARLSAQGGQTSEQRDVLRTLEVVFLSMAVLAGVLVVAGAHWIAARWIGTSALAPETVTTAVRLMGLVLALQLPSALYQGGLLGLQKQDLVNGINGVVGTVRGAGAVLLLWGLSPSIEVFFAWQAAVSALQTILMAGLLWHSLSGHSSRARFRPDILRRVRGYAGGVAGSTIIAAGLTQADKLVLSSILPLRQFGYYTLAWSLAAALWSLVQPVSAAFFPRLTELVELGDDVPLAKVYHLACQLVGVLVIPVAVTVIFFPSQMVYLWTGNPALAANTALLVRMLMIGTLLNVMASVPISLQWAAGWSQLMMWANCLSAAFLIPTIVLVAPHYGAPGAASAWIALNLGYLLVCVPIMHRRLLPSELWVWYGRDVGLPLLTALLAAGVCRLLVPGDTTRFATGLWLCMTGAVLVLLVAWVSPRIRAAIGPRAKALLAVRLFTQAHST